MICNLDQIPLNQNFDINTRYLLSSDFDLNFESSSGDDRLGWFEKFLQLSRHDISLAHCLQKHHTGIMFARLSYLKTQNPRFLKKWIEDLGSFSVSKKTDSAKLNGFTLTGTKYWMTQAKNANFWVMKVNDINGRRYTLLIDKHPTVGLTDSMIDPIGMKSANAQNLTFVNYQLSPSDILEIDNTGIYDRVLRFYNTAFLTNYLGCAIGLLNEFKKTMPSSLLQQSPMKQIELSVASLHSNWRQNLSQWIDGPNDSEYWQKKDLQYHQGKIVVSSLLSWAINSVSSRNLDGTSPICQKLLNAMVYVSHQQSPWAALDNSDFANTVDLGLNNL